ncbi:hypothetical protein EGM51_06925 [Verrucomicrobia bacterium S94]|nr:hypothetical protein EGM51_06925 [Verrucomicrobia bacterium S94]
MDTSDKIILGVCSGCLLIGLLQHRATTRRETVPPQTEMDEQSASTGKQQPTGRKANDGKTYHIVNDMPEPGAVIAQKSRNRQKLETALERREKWGKEKWDPRDSPDYFQIREGYKNMILNDPSSTLTEAERWEIIESRAIPW